MSALQLLRKTNSKGRWNVAAWHSMHSITWLWILSFALFRKGERRVFPLWASWRDNNGLQWILRVPFVGMIQWHKQRSMWWRDSYMRSQREDYQKTMNRAHERNVLAAMAEKEQHPLH